MFAQSLLVDVPLSAVDFYILTKPFSQAVEDALPVPSTVSFVSVANEQQWLPLKKVPSGTLSAGKGEKGSSQPVVKQGKLIIPLVAVEGRLQVAVLVEDVDPQILRKMSTDWLRSLQTSITRKLGELKLSYVDPATGLYNQRAAALLFDQERAQCAGCFFLLKVSTSCRTAARCFSKERGIALFFQAVTKGIQFSFGNGLLGLIEPLQQRKNVLNFCHALQKRLKGEGARKVQIGFRLLQSGQSESTSIRGDMLWQALAIAEKRGPFGIYDASLVELGNPDVFALPSAAVLKEIRKWWVGSEEFSLVCIKSVEKNKAFSKKLHSLTAKEEFCIHDIDNATYILLAEKDQGVIEERVQGYFNKLKKIFGSKGWLVGVSSWPYLNYSKTDSLRNCQKVFLHGSFYEEARVVFCDHLTLNISGDRYLEEGDHRSAIREYQRGLDREPGELNLLNSLGVAQAEVNQRQKARVSFQEVLDREPDNFMALVNLGFVELEAENLEKAVQCFEQAFDSQEGQERESTEIFLPLAKLYCRLGSYGKVVVLLESGIADGWLKADYPVSRMLGLVYWKEKQHVKAMKVLQRVLQDFPEDSLSMSLLGVVYAEAGEGDDLGLSLCDKALTIDGFIPENWCRIGSVYLLMNMLDKAKEAAQRSLALDRGNPEGRMLLARIYEKRGSIRSALSSYRQVRDSRRAASDLVENAAKAFMRLQIGE